MAYGLDIGAGVVTGIGDGGDERPKSAPLVATPVSEGSLESAGRSLASASTVDVDGVTYAVGADANAIATATNGEPHDLFASGTPVDEPYTRPSLDVLVDVVVPERIDGRGCYATAGTAVGRNTTETDDPVVESVLAERTGEWTPIERGFAVVYDQLAADNYTGLGICLGRQTTSVALAYYGVPALAFTLPLGGEWLVERAAADTGATPERVATALEKFALEPDAAAGEIESALARAYDALVGDVVDAVDAIRAEADAGDLQSGLAIPIALGGERAAEGVEHLFGARFDASSLPFSVRGVRLADEPAQSAARGALAAACDGVTGDDGVTLSFDESLAREREPDPADAAVDELFDRLADRDEELPSMTADIERLTDDVGSVRERAVATTALRELETDLERIEDSVSALDVALAELATNATNECDALAEAVAALETDVENVTDRNSALETDLETLRTDLRGFDERAAMAADFESLDDRVDELGGDLADVDGRVDRLGVRTDDARATTEDNRDGVAALREDLERAAADAADAEAVADLRETVVTVRESAVTAETDGELTARLETLEARLDALETEVTDRIEAVESTVDERTSERVDRLEEGGQRVDALAAEVDELAAALESADGRGDERSAEIDALRADLESVRPDSAETSAAVSVGAAVAAGGGAGLVAGGAVALAGATTVGAAAAVVGVLLLVAAVLLGR